MARTGWWWVGVLAAAQAPYWIMIVSKVLHRT